MFNPAQLTLGEIASAFRDFAIVAAIAKLVWMTRGVYEHAKAFFKHLDEFMTYMQNGMQTLLENHLKHIEGDLATLAGRKIVPPGQE